MALYIRAGFDPRADPVYRDDFLAGDTTLARRAWSGVEGSRRVGAGAGWRSGPSRSPDIGNRVDPAPGKTTVEHGLRGASATLDPSRPHNRDRAGYLSADNRDQYRHLLRADDTPSRRLLVGGAIAATVVGVGLVNVGFTILAVRIIDWAGRRPLLAVSIVVSLGSPGLRLRVWGHPGRSGPVGTVCLLCRRPGILRLAGGARGSGLVLAVRSVGYCYLVVCLLQAT